MDYEIQDTSDSAVQTTKNAKLCVRPANVCITYGHYPMDKPDLHCEKCHKTCKTCFGKGDRACLTCMFEFEQPQNNRFFFKNQCMLTCPQEYTYDQGSNICFRCATGIKKCGVGAAGFAIECIAGLYYHATIINGEDTRTCIKNCPEGYFGNRLASKCEKCFEKCTKCSGSAF